MNYRFLSWVSMASTLALGACSTALDRKVGDQVQSTPHQLMPSAISRPGDTSLTGAPQSLDTQQALLTRSQLVTRSDKPWVGGLQSSRRDGRLPAVFDQANVLDFGREKVSLGTVAMRLARLTSIPVRVRDDVYQAGGTGDSRAAPEAVDGALDASAGGAQAPSSAGMPQVPLHVVASPANPAGADRQQRRTDGAGLLSTASPMSIDALEMRWNGSLRGFLDHLTNSLGLAWEYQDGGVVIMRLVTESYQLAITPGKQTYSLSAGGTGSSSSAEGGVSMTSQSATNVSTSGVIDVRESILKNVQEMVASVPGSFANWADGSGRLLVVSSKENQARVRDFVRKENKSLRQRVNVTFDIYSVRRSDADEQGVDWSSLFTSLNRRYGINFGSPAQLTGASAGTLSINTTSRDYTTTNNAILALLSQQGETVQHRPVSFSTSQGVWDTTGRLSTTGYLKETTPGTASASGSAGAPGLKTDLITTGDQYSVLPLVQDDHTTLLRFSITLSDLIGLFDVSTGSGETLQKVQTPQVEAITKGSLITLAPHETAVVTGLTRRVAKRSDNRLTENAPLFAGGSRSASIVTEHLLILVRATPL